MARKIEIEIVGDTKGFTNALGKASDSSQSFGKSLLKMGGYAAAAVGAAGIGGLAVALKVGISEFAEASKVAAQTNAVLKSTGEAANVSAQQVSSLAESLMKKSGVDDEAIQSGENLLLTFTKVRNEVGSGNDIFNQATKATLDMSVAMGKDMTSSALLVGKALNDPLKGMTALTRAGIQFTEEQKKTITQMVKTGDTMGAQKVILGELTTQFGGSAKALGETLPGQINILKESFSNLAGDMVSRLVPTFQKVVAGVSGFVAELGEAEGARAKFQVAIGGIGAILDGATDEMKSWGPAMATAVETASSAIGSFSRFAQSDLGQFAGVAIATSVTFAAAAAKMAAAWKALQLAVVRINPVFAAVVIAAGLLGGAIFDVMTKSDNTTAALDKLKGALDRLLGTAQKATDAKLKLSEANNRLKAATLQVETATKTQAQAEANAGKGSLEYRTATNQLESAKLAVKRATIDQGEAEKAATAATKDATQTQTAAKTSVANLQKSLLAVNAAGHEYQRTQQSGQKVTKELMDIMDRQSAARYAKQMGELGDKASETAKKLRGEGEPALAAIAAGVAKAARANAKFAEETGKIPEAITKVKGPAVTAMNQLGSGVAGAASSAGASVGASFAQGVGAGIAANLAYAAGQAEALVIKAEQAARAAAKAKSPSQLFAAIGADLVGGLAQGIQKTAGGAANLIANMIKGMAGAVDIDAWAVKATAALEKYGGGLTATEALLAKMTAAQERAGLAAAVADAKQALSAANAMKAGKERNAAILAAEQQLRDAQLAMTMAALGKQAELERAARDKEVAAQIDHVKKIQNAINARVETLKTAFAAMGTQIERAFGAKTQAMLGTLAKKWDEQIEGVRKWAASLTDAEKALAAFDVSSQAKTMSELALATLDAAEAERDRQRALSSAKEAVAKAVAMPTGEDAKDVRELADAKADLATATAANAAKSTAATLKAVRDAGQKVADLERGLSEETKQRATDRAAAIVAAEEQLRSAELAITRAGLQAKAEIERQALVDQRVILEERAKESRIERDKQAAEEIASLEGRKAAELANYEERRGQELTALQKQLTQLQTYLAKHPKEYKKVMGQITKLLDGYDVDLKNSGELLGKAFAKGMDDAQEEVRKSAKALAAIVQRYLQLKSPAEAGPLSTLDRWFKPMGPMLAKQMSPKPIAAAAKQMAAAALGVNAGMALSVSRGGTGMRPAVAMGNGNGNGGGWPERIVIELDRRVVAEAVATEFRRQSARNR